jgi:Ca2+-binding RTX toxin-like protein
VGLVGTIARDTLIGDDGANTLNGLVGRDTLVGNGGNDTLSMAGAGALSIDGGAGNDLIQLLTADAATYGFAFRPTTQVQGGTGYDTLELSHIPVMTFTSTTVRGIEQMIVDDGFDYDFTSVDATVAAGARMLVDGAGLTLGNNLHFNGAAETNGAFDFLGGEGADVFTGGALADTLAGGGFRDTLTGGAGGDTFVFNGFDDSTFSHRDHITDFDTVSDRIQLDVEVTGVDTKVTGSASTAADVALLVKGHMGADHAILVGITGGTLAGMTLLLVDANHTANYQSAADYCIDVTGISGGLAVGDFIM